MDTQVSPHLSLLPPFKKKKKLSFAAHCQNNLLALLKQSFPFCIWILTLAAIGLLGWIVGKSHIFFYLFGSAHLEWNLDGLLEKIWEYLNLTRIYTKPKGMNPDYEDPVILSSKRRTVEDFCTRIHKDMLKQYK